MHIPHSLIPPETSCGMTAFLERERPEGVAPSDQCPLSAASRRTVSAKSRPFQMRRRILVSRTLADHVGDRAPVAAVGWYAIDISLTSRQRMRQVVVLQFNEEAIDGIDHLIAESTRLWRVGNADLIQPPTHESAVRRRAVIANHGEHR